MPIESVVLRVADLDRAVTFYSRHLQAELIVRSDQHADLDLVTARLTLQLLDAGAPSIWRDEDATRGFRHLGLKVADIDTIVRSLDEDGVTFRSRPLDIPDVGVRNAFFFDPDGTVIELVENHLQYHAVIDEAGVAAERELPVPARPRFDHIGHTVEDLDAAIERYSAAGFTNIGRLAWPSMHLEFLRSGNTVIELFKLPRTSATNPPVADSYGFSGITMDPMPDDLTYQPESTAPGGLALFVDPDDLAILAPASRLTEPHD